MPNITTSSQEIDKKIRALPDWVIEAMAQAPDINQEIADKYNLDIPRLRRMVYTIVHTIIKDISLEEFPEVLKKNVGLSDDVARQMALDIALKRFLILRKHLGDIESLIRRLGGQVPEILPEPPKPKPTPPAPPKQPTPSPHETLIAKLRPRRPTPYREPIPEKEKESPRPPVPPSNIVDLSNK